MKPDISELEPDRIRDLQVSYRDMLSAIDESIQLISQELSRLDRLSDPLELTILESSDFREAFKEVVEAVSRSNSRLRTLGMEQLRPQTYR